MEISYPPVMVKASVLSEKLQCAIGDGIEIALLLTTSGSLLSTASNRIDFAKSQECRMLAALTANIWRTYASTQKGVPHEVAPPVCFLPGKNPPTSPKQPNAEASVAAGAAAAAASSSSSNPSPMAAEQQQQQEQQKHQPNNDVVSPMHNTENSELDFVIAELETNKLCCFGMGGKAVLALFSSGTTEIGLLKLKAASLQGELFDGIKLALRQDTMENPTDPFK